MSEAGADAPDVDKTAPSASATSRHVVKPRLAASMVLIDVNGTVPKILLGKRHQALAFLPGKYVFPGGRLEACDRLMTASGTLSDQCLARLARRRPSDFPGPKAFALAAIRETFEETGLLLGRRSGDAASPTIPPAWQTFAAHGFTPDLAPLRFVARALTPPTFPKRYDTSFFAVDVGAIAHRVEGCVTEDSELVEVAWLPLAEAAKHDIPAITAMILLELETRIAKGCGDHLPVPFFYERGRHWIREEL